MTTKSVPLTPKGGHTAGIYADMSVDGPPIGTLVTVVDRAKNLPNRKTIGKQDPYCAARLGKEAKKTATDVRGGQTPKWDQELRFTAHDSPDYYQLKISVFTDDKKTDLIGEAWIDLKAIIVPGGGQDDVWQTLVCRGKYAGEIRLEITYYDSRPKPEKPAVKRRLPNASDQDLGSVKQRGPSARRPLPFDPVTGEAPSPPPSAPPPAALASPEPHPQTPPRPHGFIPTQSPLQSVEYTTPVTRQHSEQYSPSPQLGYSTGRVDGPRSAQRPREAYDVPSRHYDEGGYGQTAGGSPYDQPVSRGQHSPLPEYHHPGIPLEEGLEQSQPFENECPPPPPAHRSMPSGDGQEGGRRSIYDSPPQMTAPSTPMRHGVLRNEAHRHSAPSYPGRPTFQPYDPNSPGSSPSESLNGSSLPRYHSFDTASNSQHRSMQPTVEDAPESPPGALDGSYRYGGARSTSNDEMMFESAPRSEIMDLMRSPPASSRYASQSPGHGRGGLPISSSLVHVRNQSNSLMHPSPKRQSHRPSPRPSFEAAQIRGSPSYTLPQVPASLSPGMDSALSQEILEHIYEDRRHDGRYPPPPGSTPTRSRHNSHESQPNRSRSPGGVPRSYEGRSGVTYSGGPDAQLVRRGHASPSPSPTPQHRIPRKSVSPGPSASEERMISDTPFSPDSYDALNPALRSPRDAPAKMQHEEIGGKIITHDGREIDPSDHLPMESWAPEPEVRVGQTQTSVEPRTRASPSGAQPMPPSGRRPLRVAGAQPGTASPPSYSTMESPRTAPVSRRSRLQKKANRGPSGHPAATSPLAPVSTDNFQERQIVYTQTGGPRRWGSWDYPNENHAPPHDAAPPIPAKVPFRATSDINGGELALMHEMQRIDIGLGRSRRRGGY